MAAKKDKDKPRKPPLIDRLADKVAKHLDKENYLPPGTRAEIEDLYRNGKEQK